MPGPTTYNRGHNDDPCIRPIQIGASGPGLKNTIVLGLGLGILGALALAKLIPDNRPYQNIRYSLGSGRESRHYRRF